MFYDSLDHLSMLETIWWVYLRYASETFDGFYIIDFCSCHLIGFTNQKSPFRLAWFLKLKEMCFLLNLHVWNFKHIYGSYVTGLIIQNISGFTLNAAMGSLNLIDEMQAEQTSFVKPFFFFKL